MTEKGIVAEST